MISNQNKKYMTHSNQCSIQFSNLKDIQSKFVGNVVITDDIVYSIYKYLLKGSKVIVIEHGENNKTLDTAHNIYIKFIEYNVSRNTTVYGFGGGLITDITGYVCSTFMRGCKFEFIPTTLLADIDAAIGGKNGVNFNGYKNLIGTINEPCVINICMDFLSTLPKEELYSGYGEAVKYAILFNNPKLLDYSKDDLIRKCIEYKNTIVTQDKYECGVRKLLNLGHTIGHAVEKYFNYKYSHGQSVLIGIYYMLKYSLKNSYIDYNSYKTWSDIINKYMLSEIPELSNECLQCINCDKKHNDEFIDIVVIYNSKCEIETVRIKDFINDIS